jgi:hypothetical protein
MILALAGSLCASGQGGFISHYDDVQAGRSGFATSVKEVSDGYLLFSLGISNDGTGRTHVFVWKVDEQGSFVQRFEHRYGDDRNYDIGFINSVGDLPGQRFQAALAEGWHYSGETWLYTFDQTGDTIARKYIMSFPPEDSTTHAIRQTVVTSDTGLVLCGFFERPGLIVDAFLVRLNTDGDTLWTSRLGTADQAYVALGIQEYVDGGFVLTGFRNYGSPWNKSFLIRTDAEGNQLWRRLYGGIAIQNGAVRVAADGGIITWSTYREPGWDLDWQQMMLTKWSPTGSVIWQRKVNKDYQVGTQDMEILSDGSIVGAGTIEDRAALVKFNADGDSLWTREYTLFGSYHGFYDVQATSDGGFVCTGAAFSFPPTDPGIQTSQVIWVVKTDSLGCVVPGCNTVGVEEYVMDLNEHLRVWPNPVAAGAPLTLAFEPPQEFTPNGPLRVVVLDALGKQVHEERVQVGTCQLANLPLATGVYHLHLTDNTRWLAGANFVVE